MRRIRAAQGKLQPGDITFCGNDDLARIVIDSDLAGRGRSWHELPLSNLMCTRGGAAKLQRWPYGGYAVTSWRP